MSRAATLLLGVMINACATVPKGDLDALKPAIESFYQRARWKDFRSAAELIVPERRTSFLQARATANDEKDLFITNVELDEAKLSADTLSARAYARVSWYRLPSTTEETKAVTSLFVWREGAWLLESQTAGPFPELAP
jgi:hypothetical protein